MCPFLPSDLSVLFLKWMREEINSVTFVAYDSLDPEKMKETDALNLKLKIDLDSIFKTAIARFEADSVYLSWFEEWRSSGGDFIDRTTNSIERNNREYRSMLKKAGNVNVSTKIMLIKKMFFDQSLSFLINMDRKKAARNKSKQTLRTSRATHAILAKFKFRSVKEPCFKSIFDCLGKVVRKYD